jgi:hypothetical protein
MGADLIGYFAVGPRELDLSLGEAAFAAANRRLDWLREVSGLVNGSKPLDNARLCQLLACSPYPLTDARNRECDEIDLNELTTELNRMAGMIEDFDTLNGEMAVGRFLLAVKADLTKSSSKWYPAFRDCAMIRDPQFPERVIVFAGDTSWGDTPQGRGFQLLAEIGALGIAEVFGIHVCASFFTLILQPPTTTGTMTHDPDPRAQPSRP